MTPLGRLFSGLPKGWIIGLGTALTVVVGVVERVVPFGDSLWVLYLIPIALVTWYVEWRWGLAIALLSLLPMLLFSERLAGDAPNAVNGTELTVRFALIAGLVYLLGQSKRAAGGIADALRIDPSTGLANSRALFDLIAAELDRAKRYTRPFTVAYVGIHNLPAVRLRSGTDAAEDVVRGVARDIRASIRSVDYAARLREREFALLLPETGAEAAGAVLSRMEAVLERSLANERPAVSFSIGALTWLRSEATAEELHQQAYQLMYAARHDNARTRHEVLDEIREPLIGRAKPSPTLN